MSGLANGGWPAIWLIAGPDDPMNDEIDLFEGGFTDYDNSNDNFAAFVHADGHQAGGVFPAGADLTAGTHTFAMTWVPGRSITWYLDGREIDRVTSRQIRIPSRPLALVFSEEVAKDSVAAWHTISDGSNAPKSFDVLDVYYSPVPRQIPVAEASDH